MAQKCYGIEQIVPTLHRADVECDRQRLHARSHEELFSGSTAKLRHEFDGPAVGYTDRRSVTMPVSATCRRKWRALGAFRFGAGLIAPAVSTSTSPLKHQAHAHKVFLLRDRSVAIGIDLIEGVAQPIAYFVAR